MSDLFMKTDATFSPCGLYRYTLERTWGGGGRIANFLMLNPSTADAEKNDATVERQIRRVIGWKRRGVNQDFDGLAVTNLFAWRSTDPDELLKAPEPIGAENDRHILEQARRAAIVVCGWGSHRAVAGRSAAVLKALRDAGITPHALKVTTREPWHPLYIGYDAVPFEIRGRYV